MNTATEAIGDRPVPALKLASAIERMDEVDAAINNFLSDLFGEENGEPGVEVSWLPSLYEAVDCGADRLFATADRMTARLKEARERLL